MNRAEGQSEAPASADLQVSDCPICSNVEMDFKILPCGHLVCRSCLVRWLEVQEMAAGCPLCRYPILETMVEGDTCRENVELVADVLPTDLFIKATVRGKQELTSETCLGCEDLLCQAPDIPHPLCTGHGNTQDTGRREMEARASLRVMSANLQRMVSLMVHMEDFIKDREEEFKRLVAVNETVRHLRSLTVQMIVWFKTQASELRTVLTTHQHLIDRLEESHHVVATILMKEAMLYRVEVLKRKGERFQGTIFRSLFAAKQTINQLAGGQLEPL